MNNDNLKIKTAYMHHDTMYNVYNMFIFIEFCSIGFCLQRISDNKKTFYTENLTMYDGNILFIYENINDMNMSIYLLKKELQVKKMTVTQGYARYIRCFSCLSCNYFVYVLRLAYLNEMENLHKYGIYYDFETKVCKFDDYNTKLQECLAYHDKKIIKKPDDLGNKIKLYILSGYDDELFESVIESSKYTCDYVCDETNVECGKLFDKYYDNDFFHCIDCFNNNHYCKYSLCKEHLTDKNIKIHCDNEHNGEHVNFNNIDKYSMTLSKIKQNKN